MLTKVGVEFENEELIIPVVGVTTKDSLLIKEITGLNPPDINLFIGEYSRDGGLYQGRRVGNRNVVMTLDLNPNPALGETIAGLREKLYKIFVDPLVDADYVKLNLYDDRNTPGGQVYTPRVRYVVGYTEKFETEIFGVESMAQISLICPDPYLREAFETVLTHPSGWTTVPFKYTGTAETGFEVNIAITAPTNRLTLTNNAVTNDPLDPAFNKGRMILTRDFAVGDLVTIRTIRGERKITVLSPGSYEYVSAVANLDPASPWIELHSQANTMRVYGETPDDYIGAIRELRYTQAYWGI